MDGQNLTSVVPEIDLQRVGEEPMLDFTSGYVQRAMKDFPRQGDVRPWKLYQNYILDLLMLGYGKVEDPELKFGAAKN